MDIKKLPFEPMNEVHQKEVEILERLLEFIKNQKELVDVYNEFLEDVKRHFSFEEDLMQKYDFFAKIPHSMEHSRIIDELEEIKKYKLADYQFLQTYFEEYFIPWLINHIETMDTVTSGYFDMIGVTIDKTP
jgi:hemerythrin